MTVHSGALLSDVVIKSAIIAGEDGSGAPPPNMAGFEFGVDPNIDPELALVRTCTLRTIFCTVFRLSSAVYCTVPHCDVINVLV